MRVSVPRALVLLVPLSLLLLGSAPVSFQNLEESLTCQCGCGLTVHSCNHVQCGSAIPLRQEIRQQMALGKTRQEILAHFSQKYGEKILSAPTTTGFNLMAWVMPFLLLAAGGIVVGIAIFRWSHRAPPGDGGPEPGKPRAPSPYDRILEKELRDFEG